MDREEGGHYRGEVERRKITLGILDKASKHHNILELTKLYIMHIIIYVCTYIYRLNKVMPLGLAMLPTGAQNS